MALLETAQTNFRRRLTRAFVLPLVLMLTLASILFLQLNYLLSVTQWVEHTDQVLTQANYTQKLILDMETGIRGYILTGNEDFLKPYQDSRLLIDSTFDNFNRLISDNSIQVQRLKALRANYQQWISYAPAIISRKQLSGDFDFSVIDSRRQAMDRMRTQIAQMIKTEEQLRKARTSKAQRTTQLVLGSTIGLTMGLGTLIAFFTRRQLIAVSRSYAHTLKIAQEQTEALRENEERFRLLVEGVKDYAIFMLDVDGRVMTWNVGAERIKGYRQEEIIGEHVSRFYPDEDIQQGKPEQDLQRAIAKGRFEQDSWRVRKDGSRFWANATLTTLRDEVGNLRGFAKVTRDITERKQAEEELKQSLKDLSDIKFALDQAAILAITDSKGVITYVNERFCELSKYSAEELIGQTHRLINSGYHSKEFFRQLWSTISSGEVWHREIKNKAKDGTYYWVDTTIVPFLNKEGKPFQYLAIRFDVTARKQAEEDLQQSEQRFRATFNQAAVGIAHVGLDGKWLLVNQKLCDIVGYCREELLQLTFQEVTYPDDLDTDLEYVRQMLTGEIQTYSMEKRYIRKDGSVIWINLTGSLVREPSGEPNYFISVIEDIAERKRAEETVYRSAQRLEALHEIDKAILAAHSPAELIGAALSRLRSLVPSQLAVVVLFNFETNQAQLVATSLNGESQLLENTLLPIANFIPEFIAGQEATRYLEQMAEIAHCPLAVQHQLGEGQGSCITVPLLAEEELLGALILAVSEPQAFNTEHREIAREVAAQLAIAMRQTHLREQLQRYTAELEQRVADRTTELQEANAELEAFGYSVSHDLRAPLRAMQGFTLALLEDYGEYLDPVGQDYAHRIVAAAQRMDTLIQDLLNYSRLTRAEINLQPIDLTWVVTEALAPLEAEIREKQVQVTVDQPLDQVIAHRTTLIQVVTNLLSNAIKFVASGVQPQVRVWAEEQGSRGVEEQGSEGTEEISPIQNTIWEGQSPTKFKIQNSLSHPQSPNPNQKLIRLWIEDNGIGIAPEYQQRIFRVFERLHGIESYPGTGIGLAIVRKGVERMGGEIGVESQLGQGSRFWIELPKAGEL